MVPPRRAAAIREAVKAVRPPLDIDVLGRNDGGEADGKRRAGAGGVGGEADRAGAGPGGDEADCGAGAGEVAGEAGLDGRILLPPPSSRSKDSSAVSSKSPLLNDWL